MGAEPQGLCVTDTRRADHFAEYWSSGYQPFDPFVTQDSNAKSPVYKSFLIVLGVQMCV